MRRLLQSLVYNRKLYDRPQDEWICGRAAEGCPCIYGPGPKGECRATGQCLPAKKGDRWVCTRLISLGAECGPGPRPDGACGCPVPPCRPQRSLRAERGRLVWLVVCLALGLVVLALWGTTRADWSMPGPLTNQHAVSAHRCTDCHVEAPGFTLSAGPRALRIRQHNQLCINCHDLGPHGDSPHGVSASELLDIARTQPKATGARPLALVAAQTVSPSAELACATCHREHRGQDINFKRLSDQQCQVCHQAPFAGFAAGHPEFAGYPYERRTRLQFDHVTHLQKHFTDIRSPAPGPTSCASCHEPAADGRQMLVKGFEQTCASCHAGQIEGAGRADAKGLIFLRLPGFDLETLKAAGADLGEWPEFCEGGLTPFMRWLLEGDDRARAALETLGNQNLSDLKSATPAQKAAAADLLWSIKGLFADLVTQGQPVLLRRLGSPPDGQPARALRTGQFSADVALAAQQAWLPNLLAEVAAHRRGEKIKSTAPPAIQTIAPGKAPTTVAAAPDPDDLLADLPSEAAAPNSGAGLPAATTPPPPPGLEFDPAEDRVAAGGWYRLDDTYTLYYRPGGHEDAFLRAWIDGTAGHPAPTAQKIFSQLSAGNAPGVCMKCHTVDRTAAGTMVNWRAARPAPDVRPFTTFKHTAHFSLMGDQGCATCHTIAAAADYAGSFKANLDPAVFRSNFAPLAKSICSACHQPAQAGESCQLCHNYHTGETHKLRLKSAEFSRGLIAPPKP
ncbi:MAG: hypothetical protein HYX71_05930 [Opitutae bacterium]|nr:hypothetical protein [Opitutae bacterium]